MEQITFNPSNEPYYSEDFIKGFECGAKRQFEADKKDRPKGKWKEVPIDDWKGITIVPWYKCTVCGVKSMIVSSYCPNCGADMDGKRKETDHEQTD